MKKYKYKVDVPVFLVFFNRPEPLKKVFESIRMARPSKLFLCQDGAREGNKSDLENINKCREIVSNIDWECEVYHDYSKSNLGCGMRIFSGITNAFKKVDRLIIIEDDIVANQSFYRFCEELLEKYRDDKRINMISGMNHMGIYDKTKKDYFFTESGSIWGWATWKRAWEQVEYDMPYIEDKDLMNNLYNSLSNKQKAIKLIKTGEERRKILSNGQKLSAWSYQAGMGMYLNNQVNIVPKYNLISNIGLTEESVHAVNDLKKIPKGLQRVFFAPTYELNFPINHPKYMINDKYYEKQVDKIMGNNFWINNFRKLETALRFIIYGDIKGIYKRIKKKVGMVK